MIIRPYKQIGITEKYFLQEIRMKTKNSQHKTAPVFNKELCIACSMCVDICPTGALDLQIANSPRGFRRYPYLISAGKCTGCASCEKQCPVVAIIMAKNLNS